MKSITYNEKLDIILSILFEANSTKDSDIVPVQSEVNEIAGLHQNLAVDISLGIQEILLQLHKPIKLTTLNRSKLTTYFAGEEFQVQGC